MTPSLAPFPLGDAALGDGSVFARARDEMLHLARVYPVDRLLAVFRVNAGIDAGGAMPPGGWEELGHPAEQAWGEADYPGRENAQTANLLRGHYAGHFLSMLALAAAGERDQALTDKVDEFVAGLGDVQDTLAATGRYSHPGFLAAYGEWQFARLEHFAPYGEIWAPYYTCHKIMAGLLDAYELAGSHRALEIVTAMGHWVAQRLGRLDPDQRQRMWSLYIAGEFGGMNETLARLSVAADEPAFLTAARMFDMDHLIDAGARGEDVLTGMHANQHLPQLIGYIDEYELTGEQRYLDAAKGLWHQIVPGRTFAHGGTGESELWGPPDTVAGNIGRRNAETCATYNLLKLARRLFAHTRDPQYMEYTERALLNHILASRRAVRSDTSPEVAYMFPVDPGAAPEFDNIGTCCGGTGLENHVTYQESVFFRAADGSSELWVNLLAPARLRWEGVGTIEIAADYPWGDNARIRVKPSAPMRAALHIRIPSWARGAHLTVGGEHVEAVPGQYARIEREWHPGDAVDVLLPRALATESAVDDPRLETVTFGPSVLVARSDRTTFLDVPLPERRRTGGGIAHDGADAAADLRERGEIRIDQTAFRPVWTGSDEKYHMYVRATAREIAFAGHSSGVPVRRRDDGTSVLDDVWRDPAPQDAAALRDRVLDGVVTGRRDGLLTRDEQIRVLASVAGVTSASGSRVDEGSASWRTAADGTIEWDVPADAARVPPTVRIEPVVPADPSGWFTQTPRVRVDAIDVGDSGAAAPTVTVRIDDGPWQSYDGPFVIEGEGIVRVGARAIAPDGRAGRGSRELAIDTEAPEVEARVRVLGGSAELDFRARDDVSGVERIQWGGEGTFWATFQEAFVKSLTDREQVIEFSATDRAGNEGERQCVVLPARA